MKLSLEEDEITYRIRTGEYCIEYEIRDKVLVLLSLKVGHLREIYRR
jgi:mRNA-degrading endonuclease RelE of RelBE toxin-antitoxin system